MNDAQKLFSDALNQSQQQVLQRLLGENVLIGEAVAEDLTRDINKMMREGRLEESLVAKSALYKVNRMIDAALAARDAAR